MRYLLFILIHFSFCDAISQALFDEVTLEKFFADYQSGNKYGSGVAAIDFDKDGDIDLFLCSDDNTPNRLYKNDGSGNYTQVNAFPDFLMNSRMSLWVDIDGDQLLDVVVGGDCFESENGCENQMNSYVLRQQLDNSFEDYTNQSGINSKHNLTSIFGGMAAGDIDNDGYLDLVITQWRGDVRLYMNDRTGAFQDVTEASGLKKDGYYWQPLLFDLNMDGWLDIYLTVDANENLFYLNNQDGTFGEMGDQTKLSHSKNDMGVSLGDYDRDEDFDIYITNIERSTGNNHNVLLENVSSGNSFQFTETAVDLRIHEGGWGWGVTSIDADNDGFLDIATTNGWESYGMDQSKLWRNKGNGSFEDISAAAGFNDTLQATSLISFDFDRDGDLDLAQTLKDNVGQKVAFRLLENRLERSGNENYLVVKPRMQGANHWAIGATVKIQTLNGMQMRPITAGISFYGQEPAEAHFGLGNLSEVDEVTIVWPGGAETKVADIAANQVITIADSEALHAPGALIAKAAGTQSVVLNWGHMETMEEEFVLERSLSEEFAEVVAQTISKESSTFQDVDLLPFTTYFYRVKAKNSTNESGWSNVVTSKTHSDVVIANPTELQGTVLTKTSIQIEWKDNATNEDAYIVERSLKEDFSSFFTIELPANTTSFVNNHIEPHTTYFYRVKASREDGESDFSNELNLTTILPLGSSSNHAIQKIYPNPTTGSFQVQSVSEFGDHIHIKLINTSGQELKEWEFRNTEELNSHQFELNVASGTYFIILNTELGFKESHKLVLLD